MLHHDYATNGIAYIQLLFDASSVPEADLPYLGILKNVLGWWIRSITDTGNCTMRSI